VGQLLKFKAEPVKVTEIAHARALRKLARQAAEIKALKKRNKILVGLLQDPYNEHVRLLNVRMRREDAERRERARSCTCIPDRASALR
jgi:hypothetical protein